MNFQNVWKSILDNNGASYDLMTGELNPKKGFMVPMGKKYEMKFIKPTNYEDFVSITRAFIFNNINFLLYGESIYMGFWVNDDQLYIDLVENIQDFKDAYKKGFDRQQIAIYDCVNQKDITIIYSYPF